MSRASGLALGGQPLLLVTAGVAVPSASLLGKHLEQDDALTPFHRGVDQAWLTCYTLKSFVQVGQARARQIDGDMPAGINKMCTGVRPGGQCFVRMTRACKTRTWQMQWNPTMLSL